MRSPHNFLKADVVGYKKVGVSMEVEVKFKAENLDEIEIKVAGIAEFVIEKVERDIYFNSPWRDFRKSDEALRIRSDVEGVTLTYKGRKVDSETKSREEIKVKVDSYENAFLLLERLGFVPVREVVKRRKIYRRGDILICLDSVEGLGDFVEIEVESDDLDAAKRKVFEMAEMLGFDVSKSVRTSYLEMLEGLGD
jgi:adenylate cyclase class 2